MLLTSAEGTHDSTESFPSWGGPGAERPPTDNHFAGHALPLSDGFGILSDRFTAAMTLGYQMRGGSAGRVFR